MYKADKRRSFRDWCAENKVSRELAERALAHAVADKTETAYHRTDQLEQRRPLMQAAARFVDPHLGFVHQNGYQTASPIDPFSTPRGASASEPDRLGSAIVAVRYLLTS